MKVIKWLVAIFAAVVLAGCGSGGCDAGDSPLTGQSACGGDDGGTSTAQSIDMLASAVQLGTGANASVTITAIVKGAGNVSLADTAVSFSTNSGTLTSASATTDSAGVATATLSAGGDKSNRTITVTATSGSAVGTLQVAVAGTTLSFSGATTVTLGGTSTVAVKATDSQGVAIANLPVTVASSLNNGLSATSVTTDALGSASVTYTATNPGSDTLTFEGGGATTSASIQISGENFVFTSPAANAQIPVGTPTSVSVRYLQNGAPVAGRTVNFAATGGTITPSSAVTNASGVATASVTSTTAGPATLQATLTGATTAQATVLVDFVSLAPNALVLQVTPTAIGPNVGGSTGNRADVLATVTDVNGNPVKNTVVNFTRVADPSGGDLSQASATTDASGQAKVEYIAGALTTASNGVQLRASVASNSAVSGTAALTVNQSALFIALGTGNVIESLDPQTYKKNWVAYVTDANGIAVEGVTLTFKVLPQRYGKGSLAWNGKTWVYSSNVRFCPNEDKNYNGVLDLDPANANLDEDDNGSGTLEPGNVISVTPGNAKTDSSGRITLSLIYAESYSPWVEVTLRAEAVVSGTESSKEATFFVDGLASDFSSETVPPAGRVSPFGTNACATAN